MEQKSAKHRLLGQSKTYSFLYINAHKVCLPIKSDKPKEKE